MKYVIEADGDVVGETDDLGLAEAIFDMAQTIHAAVVMYESEPLAATVH